MGLVRESTFVRVDQTELIKVRQQLFDVLDEHRIGGKLDGRSHPSSQFPRVGGRHLQLLENLTGEEIEEMGVTGPSVVHDIFVVPAPPEQR